MTKTYFVQTFIVQLLSPPDHALLTLNALYKAFKQTSVFIVCILY